MPILWAINHLKFKQLKLNGKQANRLKLGICAIKFCNKYAIHLVDVSQYLVATQFEIRAIFSGEPFLSLVEWKSPLIKTCANSQAKFNLQMASILHSQRLSLFSFGGFHDASFIIVCWRNHGSVKILQKPWQNFPPSKISRLSDCFLNSWIPSNSCNLLLPAEISTGKWDFILNPHLSIPLPCMFLYSRCLKKEEMSVWVFTTAHTSIFWFECIFMIYTVHTHQPLSPCP